MAKRPVSLHRSTVGNYRIRETEVQGRCSPGARDGTDCGWLHPPGVGVVGRLLHELPSERLSTSDRKPMVVAVLARRGRRYSGNRLHGGRLFHLGQWLATEAGAVSSERAEPKLFHPPTGSFSAGSISQHELTARRSAGWPRPLRRKRDVDSCSKSEIRSSLVKTKPGFMLGGGFARQTRRTRAAPSTCPKLCDALSILFA